MRGFLVLILICLFLIPSPAQARFKILHKKDYKQIFLNNAKNSEKRHDYKSAFHSYEKALFYYKKDRKIIEAYAGFCERQQYFDKSEELYKKLYVLTKDNNYLFRSNLSAIKNGKLPERELYKITKNKNLSSAQKNELNSALVYHFSFKNDWVNAKKACDEIPKSALGNDIIATCIAASEKSSDKENYLGYHLRFSELNPKDSGLINKVIALAEKAGDYKTQEKFIKKLSALNPSDNGIKYRLAGFYEKRKNWAKASKVYEGLMASGDLSEHVKTSHAYVLSQLNHKTESPQKKQTITKPFVPKPLSGYKLSEKLFYEALDAKNYGKSQKYLAQMLKKEPNNTKLLKHKSDIKFALGDYNEAIIPLEQIKKTSPLSIEDEKFLAFLYSKTGNYTKSLELIKSLLEKHPNNKELLDLALEYSMAEKNWQSAIFYTDKLLALEPLSEKLLKSRGDLYSTLKDFPNAIAAYEILLENYPTAQYAFELSNLYMANQDFAGAQIILEPIYNANLNNQKVVDAYLNTLLAQQKTAQAYWLIKNHHLENTKNGYMIFGDMAMKDKDYITAKSDYLKALEFEPQSTILQNKLAGTYRMLGQVNRPTAIYQNVLQTDPNNLEAKLGLGSVQIDKKNFRTARRIFYNILSENPNYKPAKVAVADSYIANDDKLSALNTLDNIEDDDQTKLMKAQTYYDMRMWSDSKRILKGVATKDAEALRYKIRRDEAITITPGYSFFFQTLSDDFDLDYHKFGTNVSKNIDGNKNVFMEYNVIVYSSGRFLGTGEKLTNVTNEFKGGIQARPNKKWEYRADLGVKAFEFGDGAMLITDSWIKHYFSDKFSLKAGYRRNNIEQSYLSAVGEKIDGVFTGRAADNKFYFEANRKLPRQFYAFALGSLGFIYAQNLQTNDYFEGMIGAGKQFYNNPRNKWINTFSADLISYNSSYQYNLLKIYNNAGQVFGGYFSPAYFNATTLNLKVEGDIKKWRLKYGIKGFGGIQHAITPDQTTPTWGFSPYITYDINDNVAINASYNHFTYADLTRDQFIINAVIRGFKKHAKN